MPHYTISEIAEALKVCSFVKNTLEDCKISHLLTDSRKLGNAQETLFFALKTKRNDGAKYIEELYQKGVRNFVADENHRNFHSDANYLLVKDPLQALQKLASFHREHFSIPVIGITGSNGKTIVKDWLCQLLSSDKNVVSSPKSYNSQIGVPLSVWNMEENHDLAIFEAGISEPNEMPQLQSIIRPTIGIFTNIGQAHDENFLTRNQKIAEKLHLFTHVKTLIYNIDYPEIHNLVVSFEAFRDKKIFTWGRKPEADIRILSIEKFLKKSIIKVIFNGEENAYELPFIDNASIENAMHCLSVLYYFNYSPEIIFGRLKALTPVAMRLELKEGINNCSIINDSYSADLNSLEIALDFLLQQQQHHKRTVILSDILQSGKSDTDLYQEIALLLNLKKVDSFIGIGERISMQGHLFDLPKQFYASTQDFLRDFQPSFFTNESILLKGARIFEFEQIDQLLQRKSHQTVLEVNLNAIQHNLNYFKSLVGKDTKIMTMVKAFSYGAGDVEIANILQFNKVDYLTVAYADEGAELRKSGIKVPIMVMNPEEQSLSTVLKHCLEPEIYSLRILHSLLDEMTFHKAQKIGIHLELDTGMHRLGFEEKDFPDLIQLLKGHPEVEVKSIFSHFAASDEIEFDDFTHHQIQLFKEMATYLKMELGGNILLHIANTAGVSRFPESHFDMVRLGIGLYGISSDPKVLPLLENVSTLKTRISQIRQIEKDDAVGYSRRWIAKETSHIAIIPIGYADGLSRRLGNGVGHVQINGQSAPIIGNICMDMCMVDVTGIDCKETDEVIIFGSSDLVQKMAHNLNTIPYEVFTSIPNRVKRVYFHE